MSMRQRVALVVAVIAAAPVFGVPTGFGSAPTSGEREWDQKFIGVRDPVAAGDVNADGAEDILLVRQQRTAWIVFGAPGKRVVDLNDMDAPGFKIRGYGPFNGADAVGDFNGDGFDDIVIGDDFAPVEGRGRAGSAWIVLGKASQESVDLTTGDGDGTHGFYRILGRDLFDVGASVEGTGDINGDGLGDVVVSGAQNPHGAFVVFGRDAPGEIDLEDFEMNLQGTGGYLIRVPDGGDLFTGGVLGPGDINGDGTPDVTVSPQAECCEPKIFVVFGKSDPLPVDVRKPGAWGYRIRRGQMEAGIGSPSDVGDVNGDGRADLAIKFHVRGSRRGEFFIVYGHSEAGVDVRLSELGDGGFKLLGTEGTGFGAEIGPTARANHDDIGDIVVGAANGSFSRPGAGAVYVIFGSSRTRDVDAGDLGDRGYRIDAHRKNLFVGEEVGVIADLDGDGLDEVLAGTTGGPYGPDLAFIYMSRS